MTITHIEARRMIDAAVAKADELGIKVAVSVVDGHGQLVATMRMEGVGFMWLPEAAQGKALASVLWRGADSGALFERAGSPLHTWVRDNHGARPLYQQGAVGVRRGDVVVGAVGTAGASPTDDEAVSRAAAEALDG